MSEFEFRVIDGDGSPLVTEPHVLSDPRNAWDHIYVLAKRNGAPGSQIHVVDDRGDVVIRVGVATASALATLRDRAMLLHAPL